MELESISGSSSSLPAATTCTYTGGRRLERLVNSWEGVLEESNETEMFEESFRLRVSIREVAIYGTSKASTYSFYMHLISLSCMPISW